MQRSGLAVIVLALLSEAPMHPYRIQQLIKERGKDKVVNIGHRAQLYKTIDRLVRAELISEVKQEQELSRPERTVYTATEAGKALTVEWLKDMLANPRKDYPELTVALALLPLLSPEEATAALEIKLSALREELRKSDEESAIYSKILPRLVLIEEEYSRTHLLADITWIEALLDDLRTGRLEWSIEELKKLSEEMHKN